MDEEEAESPEREALLIMIAAWRARDWLEQHAGELSSADPCIPCLGVVRAVLRGKQGSLIESACAEAQRSRKKINEALVAVKQATGQTIFG